MTWRLSKVFWMLVEVVRLRPRVISLRGGTRSGKTFCVLQFLHWLIPRADKTGDVTSVVSETLPHLKRGAIRDFETILGHPLADDKRWNATDLVYTYPNGAKLEFFSVDSPDKVLGPKRKRLFENECNHISWETHRQLAVRTTGIILMDYNPAEDFWAIEKVESRQDCVMIKSTYLDNVDYATGESFLSPLQIAEIESNKDDEHWWKVYGLGEVGSLDGLIYEFEQIDELPSGDEASSLVEVYGLDFGFTNDPTAIVHVLADTRRKIIYADEICYRTHMLNQDIVDELRLHDVPRDVEIFADCAEPKSIADICLAGFNVKKCDKGSPSTDNLKFQLLWMKGWKLRVTKRSVNLIKELRNYIWAKDRNGDMTNKPIDVWNHLLDALRYAVWTKFAERADEGRYSVHVRPMAKARKDKIRRHE